MNNPTVTRLSQPLQHEYRSPRLVPEQAPVPLVRRSRTRHQHTPAVRPTTRPGDLMTVAEAQEILNCSHDTVYRLVHAGALGEPVRFARAIRVRRAGLEAFIAAGGAK